MTAIPLDERRKWIGASESAGLLGVPGAFASRLDLYLDKSGIRPRGEMDNERVMIGQIIEPAIAVAASRVWSWPLSKVTTYLPHPTVSGMGCSLDYQDASDGATVELKNVDSLVFRNEWDADGDEVFLAPPKYLIQVQHQLACCPGAPHGWLVALVGGNRLYRMKVERHPALIARIEREVSTFWQEVERGTPPAADPNTDLATLSLLYAKGTGETIDLRRDNELPAACAGYLTEQADEKAAKTRKEFWLSIIKEKLGPHSVGLVNGFHITTANVAEAPVPATVRRAYRRFTIKETV